jgi:hypothetical protein
VISRVRYSMMIMMLHNIAYSLLQHVCTGIRSFAEVHTLSSENFFAHINVVMELLLWV